MQAMPGFGIIILRQQGVEEPYTGFLQAGVAFDPIALSGGWQAFARYIPVGFSRTRPFVAFGFGLLHGLGFASVLGQFGLPEGAFIPALIGFNVGVELGQLTIIAAAFAAVGWWFGNKSWYRPAISVPASAAIAVIGAWWVLERTVL